ncbi:hypothetical protein LSG16_08715 [Lactococcus cremoris]|uniref:hypothetical protein n=1 Tax=Lactococcus lactis subsp. cremoris TaxID=1359 RepID=UPI001E57871D|nr:hypothetical protein [Lactococcus cremoris]MCD6632909.1 hypothetical protein [Lactococcus cremoris]
MNKLEIISFEYAVAVLNELATIKDQSFIPFEVIWNTSLGLAKARTIIYDNDDRPVIKESIGYESVLQQPYNPSYEEADSFSFIRYEVARYFTRDGHSVKNMHLLKRPDLLMVKLLELTKVDIPNDIVTPNYSTILDFETLDGTMKLPFIHSDSIEIKEPISLISKN